MWETNSVPGYLYAFPSNFPWPLSRHPSQTHILALEKIASAGFWHCSHSNSTWMKIRLCTYSIFMQREAALMYHLWQKVINILCQHRRTHLHGTPLQHHPPLPCTYFPSPVVNCIPLDDITGNKREQQDNKRSELQSTSFISDFITPQLMDVDLYTLLHLTCSIPQLPPPPFSQIYSHTLSFTLSFFQCYLWSCE